MSLGLKLETREILLSYSIVYRRPPSCSKPAAFQNGFLIGSPCASGTGSYHALSQWTCVLHGYFAWLYAQNLTQIIPLPAHDSHWTMGNEIAGGSESGGYYNFPNISQTFWLATTAVFIANESWFTQIYVFFRACSLQNEVGVYVLHLLMVKFSEKKVNVRKFFTASKVAKLKYALYRSWKWH